MNDAPDYIRQTIFQRALFSFESALIDEKKYYASDEVVLDYSKQNKKLFVSTNIFYFVSLIISYFLVNSIDSAQVTFRTPLFELDNLYLTSEILMLLLSVVYIWFLQRFFSSMLLLSALNKIVESAGFVTPAYVLARQLPNNLWAELMRYHAVGYSSGIIHRTIIVLVFLFMTFALVAQIVFINFSAFQGFCSIFGRSLFSSFISVLSLSSILFATFVSFVVLLIPIKFQLRPFEAAPNMKPE